MNINRSAYSVFGLVVGALLIALTGCKGDTGDTGPAGPPGPPGTSISGLGGVSPTTATALNMTVTSASVNSAPVVTFMVTDQDGAPVVGMTDNDFRFNIAKLKPGTNGDPSNWQNYIVRASSNAMQGSQERANNSSYPWGKLVDNKDGTYTYTFCTDITQPVGTPDFSQCATAPQPPACATPCTTVDNKPLDISYQPTYTTRIGIQMSNNAYPKVNATYDFVPAGGTPTVERNIVQTANCNECHKQLSAHGTRIDTKLCVTCHNPGSWVAAGSNSTTTWVAETVDFKHMIHKIHDGENLPSVVAGGKYTIRSDDFSDVVFPQDIRNCTKCHTNTDTNVARNTPQGDNWETVPNMAACGSCHDDVDFSKAAPPAGSDPTGHPGGVMTDNSECVTCHGLGAPFAVANRHTDVRIAESAKFKYNIVSVTGGNTPVIKMSVTDPTNADAPYNITTDAPFTQVASRISRLAVIIGWKQPINSKSTDLANPGSGVNPAQPITIYPTAQCGGPSGGGTSVSADWSCSGPDASGVYTLTKLSALPASATGTGRVGIEGHPAVLDTATPPAYTLRGIVTSVTKDWAISGTLAARRDVVAIANCDNCHNKLSLHGDNRVNEPKLCVICHNPNDTDAGVRPKNASGILDNTLTVDGLYEQSIDFKRMIHSIHGAEMRENAFVVYGYGGSVNNFGDVRFPGILNDCTTCHTSTSYQLTGIWETPTENGILGSTVRTTPNAVDAGTYATGLATPDDDWNITPTAAVCSSCHDGALQQQHMLVNGAVFAATQDDISNHTVAGGYETCAICHGPGTVADVKVVHGVK